MKELSVEQKAKRYDEAIKRAKELLEIGAKDTRDKRVVLSFFPELKESEDEKIRKMLIEFFGKGAENNGSTNGISDKDILAWLEKQNKDNRVTLPLFTFDDILALQCCMETVKKVQEDKDLYEKLNGLHSRLYDVYYLEKQGEQKPDKWNILSAKKGDMLSNGTIVLIVDSIEEFEGKPIINSWYFADSEKFYGEGTSECDRWEVDGFRTATKAECNYLLKMMSDAGYVWNTNKLELMEIEQKPAWSEEDDNVLQWILSDIQGLKKNYKKSTIIAEREIIWLKSLKDRVQPQNQWKPNEEQMELLKDAASRYEGLQSLYHDLKKL